MKKLLSILLISMLMVLLAIPVMAESDYDEDEVAGPEYTDISDIETPTGNLPNITGEDGDQYYDIEAPLVPTGGAVPTAAQTSDNSNIAVLIGVSIVSLAGVCAIALISKKKKI